MTNTFTVNYVTPEKRRLKQVRASWTGAHYLANQLRSKGASRISVHMTETSCAVYYLH